MDDRRLNDWLELVADLLLHPHSQFPREPIGWQLTRTFDVLAVSWDWREHPGRSGNQTWPVVDLNPAAHLPPWYRDRLLDLHPLVRWFTTTGDQTAQDISRVPLEVSSACDRQYINEWLMPVGIDQQLSMPYLFRGANYEAFVLGRPDDPFSDDDVRLARTLQRLICGLHLHTSCLARSASPESVCKSAERVGLTATEVAVVNLLADGHTAYGIGRRLAISPRTVNKHLEHIYRKLGVSDRLRAVTVARESGLIGRSDQPGPTTWQVVGRATDAT